MNLRSTIVFVSAYKLFINLLRIFLGIFIIGFRCNLDSVVDFISRTHLADIPKLLPFLSDHLIQRSSPLTCILAFSLILLSTADLVFIIAFLFRRRWGAIGFLIVSVLWIFVEFLFVSKFLLMPKLLALILDLVIMGFLFYIIFKPNHYFKK